MSGETEPDMKIGGNIMKKELMNKEVTNLDILERLYKHSKSAENKDKLAEMKDELTMLDDYFLRYAK